MSSILDDPGVQAVYLDGKLVWERYGMSGWQPIKTAPSGTAVIVAAPGNEPVSAVLVSAYGTMQWHTSADLFECFYPQLRFDPTHWQPLPEPPNVT